MRPNRRIMFLAAADCSCALAAMAAAMYLRFMRPPRLEDLGEFALVKVTGFVLVVMFLSFLAEFYHNHRLLPAREIAVRIGLSLGVSSLFFSAVIWQVPACGQPTGLFTSAVIIFGFLQFASHAVYRMFVKFRGFARRVLILGVGRFAGRLGALIPAADENYILSGYLDCSNESPDVPAGAILAGDGGLYETVKREKADTIVVSLAERRGVFPYQEVMACKLDGIDVIDAPSFYEQLTGKLLLEAINPSWIIFSDGFKVSLLKKAAKRAMDLACAVIGLVLTLPFLPFIAALIKLDSPGPVFYRQKRVGERERCFMLYKLRTMRQDAESATGAVWASTNDPRVTRLGAFMRKSRIDELPQFFNILRGDMSMVGPRPERPEFVERLKKSIPYYSERHFVKPGVTGWAQVRYPYGASEEDAMEKLRYDLFYIKNLTLTFDVMIILETIKVVLYRKGAR